MLQPNLISVQLPAQGVTSIALLQKGKNQLGLNGLPACNQHSLLVLVQQVFCSLLPNLLHLHTQKEAGPSCLRCPCRPQDVTWMSTPRSKLLLLVHFPTKQSDSILAPCYNLPNPQLADELANNLQTPPEESSALSLP